MFIPTFETRIFTDFISKTSRLKHLKIPTYPFLKNVQNVVMSNLYFYL